jgi:hypothetical protein
MPRNRRSDNVVSKNKAASEIKDRFRLLVQVLDRGSKFLDAAGVDQDLSKMYRQLLTHLRSRTDTEIEAILGTSNRTKVQRAKPLLRSDEEVAQLTAEQVKVIIDDTQQTRAHLAQIATLRFGMSSSAITQLGSRQALVEKLKTLLEHEQVQDSIARVASAKEDGTS